MEHHISTTPSAHSTKSDSSVFVEPEDQRKLNGRWVLWAHLPHDTDWSVRSYKTIFEFSTVEEACALIANIPDAMIQNCMLFIMRQGIDPLWEHPRNRKGGSFSYKVATSRTPDSWRELVIRLVGETITKTSQIGDTINGVTISPKRNFCIMKIWLSGCTHQNPKIISPMQNIQPVGCLFKRHSPEY